MLESPHLGTSHLFLLQGVVQALHAGMQVFRGALFLARGGMASVRRPPSTIPIPANHKCRNPSRKFRTPVTLRYQNLRGRGEAYRQQHVVRVAGESCYQRREGVINRTQSI